MFLGITMAIVSLLTAPAKERTQIARAIDVDKCVESSLIGGDDNESGTSGLYFNSMESTGVNDVLTDDFWRGNWYTVDADNTNWRTVAPGWGGTIFANPITPAGAIRNLASISKKPLFTESDYVATTGVIEETARNMAFHNLSGAGSGGYAEIFIRCYTFFVPANYYGAGNPSASYLWGAQKSFTVNRWNDDGGIFWAGIGYNVGMGPPAISTGGLAMTNNHAAGGGTVFYQNVGDGLDFVAGNWYFIEIRLKLNTVGNADGIWQMWLNDGGPTGDFGGQSPTLRANYSNIDFGRVAGDTALIGNLWLENWSNTSSFGEQFWANIKVATAGPIGFVA